MSAELPPEIRLGNDIARALHHLPADEGATALATHLKKFWEPRLRRALVERVRADDPRVDPLLARATATYLEGDVDRAEVAEPSGG
ncbi:formate dehydrogenase subunit delta [Intrasporangium calvum]|uniref:Formate dehydrogenase subunit delta n=1 Tax=Intrasporangium calvum TaxID=53358 RepID=A0ABT5GDF4_9MICO|nr:formate dehydrogenase subunit delta [Intrasporangium calvum]MDC5695830.1 formate dehydrogenase subunit delta [Intrasporangium calvum]